MAWSNLKSNWVTGDQFGAADANAVAAAINTLAGGIAQAVVATSEATSSTTYADLTTTTDTVTVTIGSSGVAKVSVFAQATSAGSTGQCFMSFAASGANTIAADDSIAVTGTPGSSARPMSLGFEFTLTGLAAGSTTFKAKYKSTTNAATFINRRIAVEPKP